jgi:hypothetical protein
LLFLRTCPLEYFIDHLKLQVNYDETKALC